MCKPILGQDRPKLSQTLIEYLLFKNGFNHLSLQDNFPHRHRIILRINQIHEIERVVITTYYTHIRYIKNTYEHEVNFIKIESTNSRSEAGGEKTWEKFVSIN